MSMPVIITYDKETEKLINASVVYACSDYYLHINVATFTFLSCNIIIRIRYKSRKHCFEKVPTFRSKIL